MNIHVTVTAEDIREGIAGDAHRCAVAIALRRSVPGFAFCLTSCFQRGRGDFGQAVFLPAAVTENIAMLDAGGTVEPFEFDVEVPA